MVFSFVQVNTSWALIDNNTATITFQNIGNNPAIGLAISGYKLTNNINGSTRTNPPNRGAW